MRLKSIKLAGFKSFVDPTNVQFPGNMSAVVGPNGCGKSNIIDAVRWVMGESSAKTLRGESMTDVIFNGTTHRQPVGQASIELLFDNADGSSGGEYAAYAEISVRRQVSRDGQSEYYLNGSRCRRRDITDLFLGTGLGPRSYAIIEQGMISRLIESRPEDLRVFIEEAAGISKYKERRRETENRMRRTTENLERLTDIREELERQLAHLQRQALAAERYAEYKAEERAIRAELLTLQWRGFRSDLARHQGDVADREVGQAALAAEQQAIATSIESWREKYTEASDYFNEVQATYYTVGGEVTRVEQALQFASESRERINTELTQTRIALDETRHHLNSDRERLAEWQRDLSEKTPALTAAQELATATNSALSDAEAAMTQWQAEWDEFNQQAAGPIRTSEVQQSRILYLEQVLSRLQERLSRLEEERSNLSDDQRLCELSKLEENIIAAETAMHASAREVGKQQAGIAERRASIDAARSKQDQQRSRLQQLRGQEASLDALQSAARSTADQSGRSSWCELHGIALSGPLFESLSVATGWEAAVEQVLGVALTATPVENLDPCLQALGEGQPEGLFVIGGESVPPVEGTLAALTSGAGALSEALGCVFTADSLQHALRQQSHLQPGQSVICRDGTWLGPDWVRTGRDSHDVSTGVIEREAELSQVRESVQALIVLTHDTEADLTSKQEGLVVAESRLDTLQREYQAKSRAHTELEAELKTQRGALESQQRAKERLEHDLRECRSQLDAERKSLSDARAELAEALDHMARDGEERERLNRQRDELRQEVNSARTAAINARDSSHRLDMSVQNLKTQTQTIGDTVTRLEHQLTGLVEQESRLAQQLPSEGDPDAALREELESLLAARVEAETKLTHARQSVSTAEHELREAERQRVSLDHQAQALHGEIEARRLQIAECNVRIENIERQLIEIDALAGEIEQTLTAEANEAEWQVKLERIGGRIQRLGPINLAAIEECARADERKRYLDAQNTDLVSALEMLENAIRKIDRETRARFRDTFDQINTGFADLFPRVFGGGTASLEMTGEDLLDTGVAIMARPPGKKNSTIHLLSGGEKAMTAIALVFSIFQLNPAPFCMLDEVDAPLDDANVGRYARMVKEMSEKVQFIFITHNKITMEAADQLMGVTMYEPGVSRLVTVDIDAAAQLASS